LYNNGIYLDILFLTEYDEKDRKSSIDEVYDNARTSKPIYPILAVLKVIKARCTLWESC
jgi:hypothetical protein